MEVIARAQAFANQVGQDDGELRDLRLSVRALTKEKETLQQQCQSANIKAEVAEKRMVEKDEELIRRTGEVTEVRAELALSKNQKEQLAAEHDKLKSEMAELKENIRQQGRELTMKTEALKAKELELETSSAKATQDLEAQVQDFVTQVEEARNEYFLDGWEAAMKKMDVDSSSQLYREVPFPNPENTIPLFSFDRPQESSTDSLLNQVVDLNGQTREEAEDQYSLTRFLEVAGSRDSGLPGDIPTIPGDATFSPEDQPGENAGCKVITLTTVDELAQDIIEMIADEILKEAAEEWIEKIADKVMSEDTD